MSLLKYKYSLSLVMGIVLAFALFPFSSVKGLKDNHEPYNLNTQAALDPANLQFQVVATGFDQPLLVTHAGDGSNRLFVVEKAGIIRIVRGGVVQATPFLDIQSIVFSNGSEQGLLALAFHPNYQANGYFYVVYTDYTSPVGSIVLARFTRSSTNPNLADPSSQTVILTIAEPYSNHNGGTLAFGPDGYLYWSTGDGGSAGDPGNNAQNLNSLLGKILRLNVDSDSPYGIPPTNPFYNAGPGIRKEIWAYGLRNPWRISFDRLTGDLYIGDVGQAEWEEIDWQPASSLGGENYGWKILEGMHCYNPATGCVEPDGYVPPIAEYPHTIISDDDNGCSVTGGFVYRGSAFPDLEGLYFYGDYCLGKIYSLSYNVQAGWVNTFVADTPFGISSFGEDEQGELYVTDYFSGKIYQVQYPVLTITNNSRADLNPTNAASVDFLVTFTKPVTGVDASDFSLTTTGVSGASVSGVSGSGDTYTVTVDTGTGSGTIRLDVEDDDSIEDLSGNPLGGPGAGNGDYNSGEVYDVVRSGQPFDVLPTDLDFGAQLNWVKSEPQTVMVTNYSGADVTMGALRRSTGKYLLSNNTCGGTTLPADVSCTFEVIFRPTGTGIVNGKITILSDASGAPHTVSLSGNGVGGTQLMTNNSFELDSNGDGLPNVWQSTGLKTSMDGLTTQFAKSGVRSVKLVGQGNKTKSLKEVINHSGSANDDFLFVLWSKAQDVPSGWFYRTQVSFYNGNTLMHRRIKDYTPGTHDWEYQWVPITVPGAYNRIEFEIIYQRPSGAVWFDSASLKWAP